jgi:hypothetical protein
MKTYMFSMYRYKCLSCNEQIYEAHEYELDPQVQKILYKLNVAMLIVFVYQHLSVIYRYDVDHGVISIWGSHSSRFFPGQPCFFV